MMIEKPQQEKSTSAHDEVVQLSDPLKTAIDEELKKYPVNHKQSALLSALKHAQREHNGWLSEALIKAVANHLEIPVVAAFEAATFYSLYDLAPVGRHKVSVCNSISCLLCGAHPLIKHIQQRYDIAPGETTADGKFTFKVVTCLGACIDAPVAHIDDRYYEKVSAEELDQLIAKWE